MSKRFVIRMMAVVLAIIGSLAISGTAQALNGGPWTWISVSTGYCLDGNQTGAVYGLTCNGGPYQLWEDSTHFGGPDQIRDAELERCLDSDSTGHAYTLPCNGGPFQHWNVVFKGTGFEISNVATGWCLDGNSGGSIYTQPCNGGNYQRWN
jgi:hypothetical protein